MGRTPYTLVHMEGNVEVLAQKLIRVDRGVSKVYLSYIIHNSGALDVTVYAETVGDAMDTFWDFYPDLAITGIYCKELDIPISFCNAEDIAATA